MISTRVYSAASNQKIKEGLVTFRVEEVSSFQGINIVL